MADFTNIENNPFYHLVSSSCLDMYELETQINIERLPYPKRVTEPKLPSTSPTNVQIQYYITVKAGYEIELAAYKAAKEAYDKQTADINEIMTYACYRFSNLLDIKNEKAQDKAFSMASERADGLGYPEVYDYLLSLVELLEIMQKSI